MKLITREILAADVPEKWERQYSYKGVAEHHKEITARLKSLRPPLNPDVVDEIIGNESWTRVPDCNDCGSECVIAVEVGEEPDYESRTATLCLPCLRKALQMAELATELKRG